MDPSTVTLAVINATALTRKRQAERAYLRQHRQAWRGLMTPLRQEINHAKGGLAYAPDDWMRCDAFEAYLEVLESLWQRMLVLSVAGGERPMPLAIVQAKNARHAQGHGFAIPNRGAHWVDWVSPGSIAKVEELVQAWMTGGTRKRQAKTKTFFKRSDGGSVFTKKRDRLLGAVTKEVGGLTLAYEVAMQGLRHREQELNELGTTRRELEDEPHKRLKARLDRALKAQAILRRYEQDDDALPRTWHGVLKNK